MKDQKEKIKYWMCVCGLCLNPRNSNFLLIYARINKQWYMNSIDNMHWRRIMLENVFSENNVLVPLICKENEI